MSLRECGLCREVRCGVCGWKGVRSVKFWARPCSKCYSASMLRFARRHVAGGRCRYARAMNESADSGLEARDAGTEGEGRMAMGIGGEGVPLEEGGAATGAGDPAGVDGVAPTGAEGVAVVAIEPPFRCEGCTAAPGAAFGIEHDICSERGCACATCERGRKEVAALPLPRWTVDTHTTDKAAISSAMAFRKPNGDTMAVMRSALCSDCGSVAVLVLADGDVVSYIRTMHSECEMDKEKSDG